MSFDPVRMLILTGSYGEGHNQAAFAIQEAMEELYPDAEVRVLDFMHWVHPKLDSFAQYCLYQGVKKVPNLYGYLYRATDRVSPTNMMNRPLQRMGRSRLLHYLDDYNPDWVVSTFPFSASVCARMKEMGQIRCRTATVITDFHPHSQWIHPYTDRYFVGSDRVRYLLRRRGISRNRIDVTGIPVRKRFSRRPEVSRRWAKSLVGFDPDLPLLVVTGGGAGIFADLPECLQLISRQFSEVQIAVICGRNEALQTELENWVRTDGISNLRIFGFVNNLDEYLGAADMVIGKSGGMTTAECLAIGTPMMIYRPLPGQETYNAKDLVRNQAALLAGNPFELAAQLNRVMKTPGLLEGMRVQARILGHGDAAFTIAHRLMEELYPKIGETIPSDTSPPVREA